MLRRLSSVRGITLVEVLIVIAIIGLVASLVFPALQASREVARRMQCTSNLRQVGVALNSYHAVHRALPPILIWRPAGEPLGQGIVPPGTIDRTMRGSPSEDEPDRAYGNWLCMLLPFLEESALASRIDFSVPISHSKNKLARATELVIVKCPSDMFNGSDNHFQRSSDYGVADEGYARNNFAMNAGTNESCLMGDFSISQLPDNKCTDGYWVDGNDLRTVRRVWGSGVGGVNKSMSFREFPRGLNQMVAVDEIRAGVNSADPRGVWAIGFVGASATAGHGIYRRAGNPNNPSPESDVVANCENVRSLVGGGESLAAMGMGCHPWTIQGASIEAGARSLHPGGVNLLMLGGSVHFVVDEVDPDVWHNMHSRDYRGQLNLPF